MTRDEFLSNNDYEIRQVEAWGKTVHVRALSCAAVNMMVNTSNDDVGGFMVRLCAASICDESGHPLFTSADIAALSEKSFAEMSKVYAVAAELNGITKSSQDDIAKN